MLTNKILTYTILLSVILVGCRENVEPPEFGFEYFGLEEGRYVTYEVTNIFHDAAVNASDTSTFILRTVVGEKVIDNSGREVNKMFRYRFDAETNELIDQRVWTGVIADSRGEVVEENQRIIRMVFAVRPDKTWNINAFNTMEEETAEYLDLHLSRSFGGFAFDSTATVLYEDFFSLVDYIKKYDVYAKGVGLVQRSYKDLTISNFDTLAISKGTETHYQLIDFGVE
jgi:hypothetical protein